MTRLVPHPLLSLVLVLMWMLLTRFSLGNLILGSAIALLAGWSMGKLQPNRPRLRRPDLILRLAWMVAIDILRSNLAVAWLILTGGRHGRRRSGFVHIQLELRDPSALAVLAIIVTATPGTAWLEHDRESGLLMIHVFDLVDESAWRDLIGTRYEALLLEIFR